MRTSLTPLGVCIAVAILAVPAIMVLDHNGRKQIEQIEQTAPMVAPKEFKLGPHTMGCMEGRTVVRVGTGTHDTYFYRLTPEGKTIPCQ